MTRLHELESQSYWRERRSLEQVNEVSKHDVTDPVGHPHIQTTYLHTFITHNNDLLGVTA